MPIDWYIEEPIEETTTILRFTNGNGRYLYTQVIHTKDGETKEIYF